MFLVIVLETSNIRIHPTVIKLNFKFVLSQIPFCGNSPLSVTKRGVSSGKPIVVCVTILSLYPDILDPGLTDLIRSRQFCLSYYLFLRIVE